jgi:thioredoxin reductase (NADPH)
MSHYLFRALEGGPSVEVRTVMTFVCGVGDARLERLVIRDGSGEEQTVAADALFVLIGARPQTDWLPDEVARDTYGFVLTGDDVEETWLLRRRPLSLETSMPGVLAAGDIRHGSVKRVAAAVGEGSIAVQHVHKLLAEIAEPAAAPS